MRVHARLAAMLLFAAVHTRASAQTAEMPPDAPLPRTSLRDVAALDVGFGIGLISRHYRYNDDVYGFLRDYTLRAGPEVTLALRVYPGRFVAPGVGDVFGLELRLDRSFGIESERQNGVRFPTVNRVLEANVLARLARRGHELVGIVGYGVHDFRLGRVEPSGPGLDNVPDVPEAGYRYVRLGIEGRAVLHDRLAVVAGAAYLFVFDTGGIEDELWFPRAQAGGMTADARVAVGLARNLEMRLGVSYRRYFLDMRSMPGDENVAGGALDQYTHTELSVAYRR